MSSKPSKFLVGQQVRLRNFPSKTSTVIAREEYHRLRVLHCGESLFDPPPRAVLVMEPSGAPAWSHEQDYEHVCKKLRKQAKGATKP